MTDMTPERRAELTAKYGIERPPMNPDLNSTVRAIIDAERIEAEGGCADHSALFDPSWNPRMWELANAAMAELHRGLAEGTIRCDSGFDTMPSDGVLLWRPGSTRAYVHQSGFTKTGDLAAHLHREHHDDFDCGCGDRDCDLSCNVRIADDCDGRPTRLLPLRRGQYILLFRTCAACTAKAGKTAETRYQFAVMTANDPIAPEPLISAVPKRVSWWRRFVRAILGGPRGC
jgi:hypothetical protein